MKVSRTEGGETPDKIILSAGFWHSPFAVAAAVILTAQTMMMLYGALTGKDMQFAMTVPMIIVAAMMLVVGVWPNWNYLALTREGFVQHAGLTGTAKTWDSVLDIRIFNHWVEIKYLTASADGEEKSKTVRLFNRYVLKKMPSAN